MNRRRFAAIVSLLLFLPAPSIVGQTLDFQVYRSRVEPIFLKLREGNGPGGACFMCHTHVNTRLRLQPVSAGNTPSWTEEQSRRNFEAVVKLVAPGDPLKSRLLLHGLAPAAGGDAIHAGGTYWSSIEDPEWQALAGWVRTGGAVPAPPAGPVLDFEVFKTRIQPMFLAKREGLARCYSCHSQGTNFRLRPLPAGGTAWSDEDSRLNFTSVQRLVVPGDPESSRLLMMPLASEAGGDPFHPGGKHWATKSDAEWQLLSSWVTGRASR
jgi:hypothetical protein